MIGLQNNQARLQKVSLQVCLGGRRTMFPVKRRFCKLKNNFEGSTLKDDVGLFYPNSQLMFSFGTFLFC